MFRRTFLLLTLLVVVLLGHTTTTAGPNGKPTGVAAKRMTWLYNKGSFRKQQNKTWVEQNARSKFTFREIARTTSYVGLFDDTRKLHVRLYDRTVYLWVAKDKKWNFLYTGRWEHPRKKPLNADRFPDERGKLQNPVERKAFPHLGREYEVLGPASATYNCIAWSIGVTHRWVWPARPGTRPTLKDFDELYAKSGYKRMKSRNYDKVVGLDKVVLYAKKNPVGVWEPTHGARQLSDGSWSSKLGKLPLIRHLDPDDLDGTAYGVPYAVYWRKQVKK